jgi:hypothetical protein
MKKGETVGWTKYEEEIIKSYEELKNYTAVGKKHKLPITTVWNIVNSH